MRKPKREYIGMLYCLPYVVVFLFGMIIPMFYALYLSFFKQSLLGGTTFAGFDNFIAAFKDEALWSGFRRVLIYAAIQIPLNLILPLWRRSFWIPRESAISQCRESCCSCLMLSQASSQH